MTSFNKSMISTTNLSTSRDYLLSKPKILEGDYTTICTLDEAITLISLYLRAQGEFIVAAPTKTLSMSLNRGLFYWVGTREVLSESWRWHSACVYHSSNSGKDKLRGLAGSTLSRVQRAIEARDRVHIALSRETNNDINDDALGNLDHVLMLLMGAVDASARVAHIILGLTTPEYKAGWQYIDSKDKKKGFVAQVAEISPELAEVFLGQTRRWYALEILRLLRNSVHGEALQGVRYQKDGKTDTRMSMPKNDEIDLLKAMDAIDGRDSWGYEPFAPGHDNILPGKLVDKLVVEIIDLLNDVMRLTPVEKLSHLESVDLRNSPPDESNGTRNVFSEWNRLSIRWQLGL